MNDEETRPSELPQSLPQTTPPAGGVALSDLSAPYLEREAAPPVLSPGGASVVRWGGWALLSIMALGVAGALAAGSMRGVVLRLVHDDAFYYFQIAQNMAHEGRSSFDGLTSTNGYHPLWQWLLVPAAAAIDSNVTLARVAGLAGVLMLIGAAWLLKRVLRRERYALAGFPLWWVAAVLVPATIYGLESPLAALAFAALVWFDAADEEAHAQAGRLRGLVAGLLSSALFLARIDSLAWVAALDAVVLMELAKGHRTRGFVWSMLLTQAVFVLGYFGMNDFLWGHPLTVSALVKAGRSGWFPLDFPWSLLCILAFLLAPLSLWALSRRPLLVWIGAGNLLYLALIVARGGRETFNWYFTLPVVSGAILIPCFIEEISRLPRRRTLAILALFFALAVLGAGVRGKVAKPSKFEAQYDMARALAELEPGAWRIALTDCGIVGAIGRQHCINLDGLTASFALQDALRGDALATWLSEQGLNACVVPAQGDTPRRWTLEARPGIAGIGRKVELALGRQIADLAGRWRLMEVVAIERPGVDAPARRVAPRRGARRR